MTAPLANADRLIAALTHLSETIDKRAAEPPTDAPSWTARLLKAGPEKCAKKMGEEAIETVIALTAGRQDEIAAETADLVYHLLVALRSRGVPLDAVADALENRQGISGVAEKASRPKD